MDTVTTRRYNLANHSLNDEAKFCHYCRQIRKSNSNTVNMWSLLLSFCEIHSPIRKNNNVVVVVMLFYINEVTAPNGLRVCKEENSGLAQINFKQLESFVKMALHIFSITFHHVKCIKVNFVFHKRKKLTLNDWILNLVALSKTMQNEQRCSLHDNNCSCQT
ncbi:hypothetical protein T09_2535 [Trichinella sp. T9]|nr:hypothetical protein T09_2535 [Trichinella sp. T9]